SYNVEYKTTASSTWTTLNTTATSLNLSSLTSSTAYQFQVQSVCSSGSSSYSSAATFTTQAIVLPCNVPAGLIATSVTSGSATLNWTSTGALSYNVHYKPTTSSVWMTVSATGGSMPVSGLMANTLYEFQVQGICSSGSSAYSASANF